MNKWVDGQELELSEGAVGRSKLPASSETDLEVQLKSALAAIELGPLDLEARSQLENRLLAWLEHTKARQSEPEWEPSEWDLLSDEEQREIEEAQGFEVDDHLEFQVFAVTSDFVEAHAAWMMDPGDHELIIRVDDLKQKVEAVTHIWDDRRKRRKHREALQAAIQQRLVERGWTREEFADRAGISLSTVRNLLVSTDPDRQWRKSIQRSVEDALGWRRGAFQSLMDTGEFPFEMYGIDDNVAYANGMESGSRLMPISPAIQDVLESVAIREGRSINDIVGDALRLYLKIYSSER
jgi:hypothetical protein